jgi:phage terminase large subunit-like protein
MNDNNEQHDHKDRWRTFTEEVEVAGQHLVDEVTRLIAEGNVRKVRVRSQNDDVVLEVPLTASAVIGGVVVLTAPWLAILGALAGLLGRVRIEVVREEEPKSDGNEDHHDAT